MSKTLDKLTKVELIALVLHTQDTLRATDTALQSAQADIRFLKADLQALENRRRFEAQAYRAKIRDTRDAAPNDGLTRAQRVIRDHKAALERARS